MTDLFGDPARFLATLAVKIPALLIAITVHELAHAVIADRLGDPTPRRHGRLTLNPLAHLDLFGAMAFVLAGFGWAKPVPVNAGYLRGGRRDMVLVAAAGPAANFVAAFVGLVAFILAQRHLAPVGEPLGGVLLSTFNFNLALGIFNLIPLPPLDGGHFLPYFLPRRAATTVAWLEQYGPFILLVLVFSGGTRYVIGPVFELLTDVYVSVARALV